MQWPWNKQPEPLIPPTGLDLIMAKVRAVFEWTPPKNVSVVIEPCPCKERDCDALTVHLDDDESSADAELNLGFIPLGLVATALDRAVKLMRHHSCEGSEGEYVFDPKRSPGGDGASLDVRV